MGIMSVLAEMHGTPDFKLNLKFEIEVLCKQLEIQLTVSRPSPPNARPKHCHLHCRNCPFITS